MGRPGRKKRVGDIVIDKGVEYVPNKVDYSPLFEKLSVGDSFVVNGRKKLNALVTAAKYYFSRRNLDYSLKYRTLPPNGKFNSLGCAYRVWLLDNEQVRKMKAALSMNLMA